MTDKDRQAKPARVRSPERPSPVRRGGVRVYQTDEDRKVAAIIGAIPLVPKLEYTTTGRPMVEPIEEILGEDITEAQRDRAWAQYQVAQGAAAEPAEELPGNTPIDEEVEGDG